MKGKKVLALFVVGVFALGCLGWTGFVGKVEAAPLATPPGQAKKAGGDKNENGYDENGHEENGYDENGYIEVEIDDGRAEVDVDTGGIELEFVLETTDRGKIIDEIVSRTGLTRGEVEKITVFEEEIEDEINDTVSHPSLKGLLRAYENVTRNQAGGRAQEVLAGLIEARGGTVPEQVYGVEQLISEKVDDIIEDEELLEIVIEQLEALGDQIDDEIENLTEQVQAFQMLARSLERLQELEGAEDHLRQALLLHPGNREGFTELNALRKMRGDTSLIVFVGGDELEFDVPPQILNGRTMLPIRQLGQNLGGAFDWNQDEQKVTFTLENQVVILRVGNETALVDGVQVTLDVPATVVEGRTLVPLRFVGESLEFKVDYLSDPGLVILN